MQVYLNSPLFIILGICGLIFLITGYFTRKKPPKKINSVVGYRSRRSMQSQQHWDFAQLYFARQAIKVGIGLFLIGLVGFFFNFFQLLQLALAIILLIAGVIYLFSSTEKAIKNNFIIREKDY
jgi:uncharacterized membrane protein